MPQMMAILKYDLTMVLYDLYWDQISHAIENNM